MALPFDIQRFASEIGTGLAVLAAARVPATWRWAKARLRPDPELPELRTRLHGSMFRAENANSGTFTFRILLTNLSARRFEIEHVQVSSWTFDGATMPQAEAQVSPPRLAMARYSEGDVTVNLRLHAPDLEIVSKTAISAPNVKSNPGHHSCIGLVFVARQRFSTVTVGPRYLEVRGIEGAILF